MITTALARLVALVVALRVAWRALRRGGSAAARDASGAGGGSGVAVSGAPTPGGDELPPEAAPPPDADPRRREVPADARAELWVAGLLAGAAVAALAFIAVYVLQEHDTQLLGLAIGLSLALLAAAVILAGALVVPQETSVEPRDELLVTDRVETVDELIHAGGEGISRRRLLTCAGCAAGGAMAAAAATPLASLGPPAHVLHDSPWRRGVRMLDTNAQPLAAADIQIGSFYTGLPEGSSWQVFGAGILVIRLPESMIHLPAARAGWTPQGIMAFSKICPHAGCAISLYRYPLYGPTSTDQPAFTCPCHYSTFTPADGGQVIFGPAGRELPQLPVMIDAEGNLRAAGVFDEDIGPSWWGVRRT